MQIGDGADGQRILVEVRAEQVGIGRVIRIDQINLVIHVVSLGRGDEAEVVGAVGDGFGAAQADAQGVLRAVERLNLLQTDAQGGAEVFVRILHVVETGMQLRGIARGLELKGHVVPADLLPQVRVDTAH